MQSTSFLNFIKRWWTLWQTNSWEFEQLWKRLTCLWKPKWNNNNTFILLYEKTIYFVVGEEFCQSYQQSMWILAICRRTKIPPTKDWSICREWFHWMKALSQLTQVMWWRLPETTADDDSDRWGVLPVCTWPVSKDEEKELFIQRPLGRRLFG